MTTQARLARLATLLCVMSGPLLAQERVPTSAVTTPEVESGTRQSTSNSDTEKPWKRWGLTRPDWERYESIMKGPRGIWSPKISPVSALGIHALSEVDRMRYAEIAAKQDWERLMSERAWYVTYDVAKDRYFGKRLKELKATQQHLDNTSAQDHLVLFTDDQCNPQCRRALSVALEVGASLDIYFVGVSGRDTIGQWAKANRIPPEAVNNTKQVTLNIDNGMFQRIALDTTLPQLFHREQDTNQLTEIQW